MNTRNLPHVDGSLNYLAPMAERPRTLAYTPEPGEASTNLVSEAHTVPIYDLRSVAGEVRLEREGFALVPQTTAVQDFGDDEEIRRVYYPEAERLLKEATGASRVVVFDHTVRRRSPGRGRSCAGRASAAGSASACRSHGEIWPAAHPRFSGQRDG